MTSAVSRPPTRPPPFREDVMTSVMPPRTPTFLDPPASDEALISAFSCQPEHTFSQSTQSMTSMLPRPLTPSRDDVMTSMLPHDVMISALTRLPTVPGSVSMQRPAARVDARNMYTNVEQLLTDSSRLPSMATQPLLPDSIDTLFHGSVPCLPAVQHTAHQYQNISATLSLPTVSTLAHAPTYVGAPQWSYTENSQRVPIGAEQPDLSAFSRVDALQKLPIAVEQAGFSDFSRVDVHDSRPAVTDSTVHYADYVRPTDTAYTAPLQSPSVHWRKRFAFSQTPGWVQRHIQSPPDHRRLTHTHTHTQNTVHLQTLSVGEGQSMTSAGPP